MTAKATFRSVPTRSKRTGLQWGANLLKLAEGGQRESKPFATAPCENFQIAAIVGESCRKMPADEGCRPALQPARLSQADRSRSCCGKRLAGSVKVEGVRQRIRIKKGLGAQYPRLLEERMFNLLQSASDDQTAIGACLLTMAGAAFLVFVSYHLGPAGQKAKHRGQNNFDLKTHSASTMTSDESHERAA